MKAEEDPHRIVESLAQPQAAASPIKSINDVPDWVAKHHRTIFRRDGHIVTRYATDLVFNLKTSEEEALAVRHIEIADSLNGRRIDIHVEPLERNGELEENGILRRNSYQGTDIAFTSQGSSFFRWPEACRYEVLYPLSHMRHIADGPSTIRVTFEDAAGRRIARHRFDVLIPAVESWKADARFPSIDAWIEQNAVCAKGVPDGLNIPRNVSIYWEDDEGCHALNRDRLLRDSEAPLVGTITGNLVAASATIDDDKHWSATIIVLKERMATGE